MTVAADDVRDPPVVGRRLDLRLAPAALVAWACGLAITLAPGSAGPVAIACAVGAVACLALITASPTRRGCVVQAAWCLALAALVAVSGGAQQQAAGGPVVEAALDRGGTIPVRAVVTSLVPNEAIADVDDQDGGAGGAGAWGSAAGGRFEVRATAFDLGEGWRDVETPLLVFGTVEAVAPGRAPAIGTEIVVDARLRAAGGGEGLLLAFAAGPARLTAPAHPLLAWADELRHRFTVEAQALPGSGGQLLPGLAVGDTRAVDAELEAHMKIASLTHLTAVSGANCVLVVGGIVMLGRLFGWSRGARAAAAGAALAAFVVLVTPEGSVIRAATMAAIVLVVDGWGRHVRGAPVLCLATIALLATFPRLAADYGFALSVAATAGLLLGTRPLAERLERWMPRWLALALAVPIAAQLACQPILILLTPSIPLHGVVANLLAAPAAPVATIVGLVGGVLATIAPPLAPIALWIAWLPAQWIGVIASGVAGWPLATLPWPAGLGGALLLAGLTAAGIVGWLVRVRRRSGRSLSLAARLLVIAVVTALAGAGIGTAVVRGTTFPANWQYAACDVGQGDALVVRAGEAVALIDTGPEPELLRACLDLLGIDRIDALVLSHFDHDHDGAAGAIADVVGAVLVPNTVEARDEPLLASLRSRDVPVLPVSAGDAWRLGDTSWRALWPPAASDGGPSPQSGNDGSLVVQVTRNGGPALLALGDLGEVPQAQLLAASPDLVRAEVVKVSHHGSSDQSAELYAATGARLALVSSGADNGYGHPTARALDLLTAAGIEAVRTDRLGTIVVGADDGPGLVVWAADRVADEGASLGGDASDRQWCIRMADRPCRARIRAAVHCAFRTPVAPSCATVVL